MHILLTNDDGVTAPGLLALAQGMRQFGEVSVLAPDHDWSGGGHVKTLRRPLRVRRVRLSDGATALASDGAPSDCVALGVMGLLSKKVDLIVSGVNPAANLGHDVTYSGTVTAVMEGIIWGVPGVAVSLDGGDHDQNDMDYRLAVDVACQVVNALIRNPLPKGTFLNVNVPYVQADQFRGIMLTRQGLRVYRDRLDQRTDPRGRDYYWIGGDRPTGVPKEGTDVGALSGNFASVTPLQLDLTAYEALNALSSWQWSATIPVLPEFADPTQDIRAEQVLHLLVQDKRV